MAKFHYGGVELEVPELVYFPREDSILMAKAIEKLDVSGKTVLEIGCGSGFLSIILAKLGAIVSSVDINEIAVEAAAENARANGVNISAALSDLFSDVKGKFHLIVFNPPYLPVEEGEKDFTYAGGLTGRETIEKFIEDAGNHLAPNGVVLLAISSLTGEREVIDLFERKGMTARVIEKEKIPWEELIVLKAQTTGQQTQ